MITFRRILIEPQMDNTTAPWTTEQNETVQQILVLTASKYPDAEVYLYGSRAREEARTLSDWDLLILLNVDCVPFVLETSVMDDFYQLELATGEIISPLIYPKKVWATRYRYTPLYENIQEEGVRLQ